MPIRRLTEIVLDVLNLDGDLDTGDLVELVEPAFGPEEPYWNVRRCVAIALRELDARGLVEQRGDHVVLRGRPLALA